MSMNICSNEHVCSRADFAMVWAGRYLNRQGHYFASDLLRRYQVHFRDALAAHDDPTALFNIVLPETEMTYALYLPNDDEFLTSELFAEKPVEELGLAIALLTLSTLPLRLKAGISMDMLPRRAA